MLSGGFAPVYIVSLSFVFIGIFYISLIPESVTRRTDEEVDMNANEVEEEVAQDLENYFGLIEEGKLEEASAMRLKLEKEIGEDYPPFVKADILTRRKQKLLQ